MNPLKVLVIDDEVEFLSGLSRVLRRRGFNVEVSSDCISALSMLEREHFDVVVLDIKMPGINGIEALHRIKRISPNTEVILMTGHLSRTEEEEGIRGGAFAYLIKPHPIDDLISIIRKAGDSRGQSINHGREE